ncbi:unnamed protein product [Parnassius mnemosyne]|uniref:Major facilitator superfamily (MFS) profile domain-containing protein n=1 Tax=Parnassius mnemosyne TaxID=213953 RepID=A0AAV1LJP6_9NEOP
MGKLKFSPFVKQCIIVTAVCSNIVCNIGFVFGFPGILLPALHQRDSDIPLTNVEDSWIASIISIGMLIGNFVVSSIMDRYGRKAAQISSSLPAIVGWFVIALAVNAEMLILARFLQGVSIGFTLPLRSVLIAEYVSPKYRGGFLTTLSLARGVGVFLIHLMGSLISWQRTSVVCGVLAFLGLVISFYLPESPSWLAVKGKYEECRKAFRWIRGDDEEKELEELIQSRIEFKEDLENKGQHVNRLKLIKTVIFKKEFYKPIIIITHCYLMVQVCGNATMPAFSVQILSAMMGPKAKAHVWMVILDSLRTVANIAAIFMIHRFKRRTILFATGGLCTLVHISIAGYVYAKMNNLLIYDAQWISGSLVILQFLCIGLGMIPMPTVIAGEVIPLEFRSIISSVSAVVVAAFMFAVLKTFPLLVDSVYLYGTYAIYSSVLTYTLVVLWILLPETSGKTLQQIEIELKGKDFRNEDLEAKVNLKSEHVEENENGTARRKE